MAEAASTESVVTKSEEKSIANSIKELTDSDEEYDTDLEVEIQKKDVGEEGELSFDKNDLTGRSLYLALCADLDIIPVSYFIRNIMETEIIMKYHGLGPAGAKAIAKTLETNTKLEKLDMTGNWLEAEGGVFVASMLKENMFIADFVCAENRLGKIGCKAMTDMLRENQVLVKLDLSANEFSDRDAEEFYNALKVNITLKQLILTHNKFCEDGGMWIGKILAQNESLESLDLSWNNLRQRGALAVAEGLQENIGLKYLCLAWNGFGDSGAVAMGIALQHNRCLLELDLTCNRITYDGAGGMSKGIEANDILQVVKVGKNSLRPAGALSLLSAYLRNDSSALTLLDMEGVPVNEDFVEMMEEVKTTRTEVPEIVFGETIRDRTVNLQADSGLTHMDPEELFANDPMTILKTYMKAKNLRLFDLFRGMDKDGSKSVTRDEFKEGIRKSEVGLTEEQLEALLDKLDADGDGEIDFSEFSGGEKEHKRAALELEMYKRQSREQSRSNSRSRLSSQTSNPGGLNRNPNTPDRSGSLQSLSGNIQYD